MSSTPVALPVEGTLQVSSGFSLGWDPNTKNYLTDLVGWTDSAPLRRDKAERLGGHGSHSERGWKDERLVVVRGYFFGTTRGEAANKADELTAFLGDGTKGRFEVVDADLGTRWAEVYLTAGGVEVGWKGGTSFPYAVYLLAPDSRKYGTAVQSATTGTVELANGGLIFPLFASPNLGSLDFGNTASTGQVSVTNTGTAPASPRFTVTGYWVPEGFTITHMGTGRRLVYTGFLGQGDSLVLDAKDGSVTLNGYAPQESQLTRSEWVDLPRGGSGSWMFEAPNSTDASMTLEVTPSWW